LSISALQASVLELADIRREQDGTDSVDLYHEAFDLGEKIGETWMASTAAFSLGTAYKNLTGVRNLDKAEQWYRRSLAMRRTTDTVYRAKTFDQIGLVRHERWREMMAAGAPPDQLADQANKVVEAHAAAWECCPPDSANTLGLIRQHLGSIYLDGGRLDVAEAHYQEAIRQLEAAQNTYEAARCRIHFALGLVAVGRNADALEYANAAFQNYLGLGDGAARETEETRQVVTAIRRRLRALGDDR